MDVHEVGRFALVEYWNDIGSPVDYERARADGPGLFSSGPSSPCGAIISACTTFSRRTPCTVSTKPWRFERRGFHW